MESKVTTREKIISCFKDGQTIAIAARPATGCRSGSSTVFWRAAPGT